MRISDWSSDVCSSDLNMSEETAKLIDAEVRRLVEEGEKAARKVLTDNIDELHLLAGALLEYETLSGEEAKRPIKGEDIGREDDADKRGPPVSGHAGGIQQIKRQHRPYTDHRTDKRREGTECGTTGRSRWAQEN